MGGLLRGALRRRFLFYFILVCVVCFGGKKGRGCTIGADHGDVGGTDGVRGEVAVCEDYLVAVTHFGEDFEEGGGDEGGDSFEDHDCFLFCSVRS